MFKYKISKPPSQPLPLGKMIKLPVNEEVLSGYVQGMKSSDIEERFARALSTDKRVDAYQFRFPVISPRNMLGQLEIDFVVQSAGYVYAFQVDGDYAHKGIGKRQDDLRKDTLSNAYIRQKYNAFPIKRIPWTQLGTQDQANKLIRELIR